MSLLSQLVDEALLRGTNDDNDINHHFNPFVDSSRYLHDQPNPRKNKVTTHVKKVWKKKMKAANDLDIHVNNDDSNKTSNVDNNDPSSSITETRRIDASRMHVSLLNEACSSTAIQLAECKTFIDRRVLNDKFEYFIKWDSEHTEWLTYNQIYTRSFNKHEIKAMRQNLRSTLFDSKTNFDDETMFEIAELQQMKNMKEYEGVVICEDDGKI